MINMLRTLSADEGEAMTANTVKRVLQLANSDNQRSLLPSSLWQLVRDKEYLSTVRVFDKLNLSMKESTGSNDNVDTALAAAAANGSLLLLLAAR
jgi:hypothetical protein